MKKFSLFTGLIGMFGLAAPFCSAQTSSINYLRQKMWAATIPEKKLGALIELCNHHQSIQKDSLLLYARRAKELLPAKSPGLLKAQVLLIGVNTFLRFGKLDSANALLSQVPEDITPKNPITRKLYFQLEAARADCPGDASNYKDALAILYKIIAEAELYKDSAAVAKNMSTIGVINYNLDHVPDAFRWYLKGLTFLSNQPVMYPPAIVLYINLAETYRWVGQTDSAAYYLDKAIPLCEQTQNLFFLANALRVKASLYKDKKQYELAEKTMLDCIAIVEKKEGKLTMSNEQVTLANIYMRSGNTGKAINMLTQGLLLNKNEDSAPSPLRISYYKTLAKCYQLANDHGNYENTLEKLIASTDAFYQANTTQSIAEAEAKYNVQKKENTILQQKISLQQSQFLLYGTFTLLAMVLVSAYFVLRYYRIKAATSANIAEEKERIRIAADLHDNIGAYASAIRADVENMLHAQPDKSDAHLQNLKVHSQEIMNSLRNTIWVLNKDNITLTGISDRIKNYVSKLGPSYAQVQINMHETISKDIRVHSRNALNIFRIVQEAVNNALKHSNAKNISITIQNTGIPFIIITDDGKGISASRQYHSGSGLANMKARAADSGIGLQIVTAENEGTSIKLDLAAIR